MGRKIYFLTELEQEIINQRRKFHYEIIKENVETQLLINQKSDDHVKEEMRKKLAQGKSVTIDKSLHPHQAPIDDFFSFIKRFFRSKSKK